MFDAVRNNKRIVQVFLILITVPFALWGVDWYTRSVGGADSVAQVGDIKISPQEFQEALREQQDRLREALGGQFDPAMLDAPEARQALLDSLVTQRLLSHQAFDDRIVVSDQQLRQFIASVPAFQDNGKFSMERYEAVVRSQNFSRTGFEARMRQQLAMQQVALPMAAGAFIPQATADRWAALQRESREISELIVKPDQLAGEVKLAADAAQKYYDANRALFETPEQVRAEYLVLNPDALLDSVTVTDDEVRRWYDGHQDQYRQSEERRASHILIAVGKDAKDEQVQAARTKIEGLLKQVKQAPGDFAKLSKEHSQDPGSAANGGDLGFFGRGMMVKPFEDAAFALKENETSDVVRSDFGFHIIKVTGVKVEKLRSLDEVKEEIRSELKQQGAARRFAEVAEQFNNIVYEQPDSLQPAADKFKLSVRQSSWLAKGAPVTGGELGNERLIAALFSDDAVKKKRNTEAVETAPNTLVAARVLEHRPAQLQPLDAVRAEVEKRLVREEAAKLAQKDGEEKLVRLLKGEAADLAWGPAKSVTRAGSPGMAADALRAVFRLSPDKLPAYTGARQADGSFALYRLSAVKLPEATPGDARPAALRNQLARLYGEEEFAAYLAVLRSRYPVTVNRTLLEAK
jgi:peptidyl-prolyl cis-trans isomerase D